MLVYGPDFIFRQVIYISCDLHVTEMVLSGGSTMELDCVHTAKGTYGHLTRFYFKKLQVINTVDVQ